MSDTTKRDAVLREFMPCGGHVCKGCEVQCINVDGRTPNVKWMADEIVRLRDENADARAEIDRLRARENVIAQHEDTGRTWNGPRCAIPSRYFEVNSAEQEVGRE